MRRKENIIEEKWNWKSETNDEKIIRKKLLKKWTKLFSFKGTILKIKKNKNIKYNEKRNKRNEIYWKYRNRNAS